MKTRRSTLNVRLEFVNHTSLWKRISRGNCTWAVMSVFLLGAVLDHCVVRTTYIEFHWQSYRTLDLARLRCRRRRWYSKPFRVPTGSILRQFLFEEVDSTLMFLIMIWWGCVFRQTIDEAIQERNLQTDNESPTRHLRPHDMFYTILRVLDLINNPVDRIVLWWLWLYQERHRPE